MWASTPEERERWANTLSSLLTESEKQTGAYYLVKNKHNNFVTSLYLSLMRSLPKATTDDKESMFEQKKTSTTGLLTECACMLQSADDTNYFTKNLYELDIEQKVLTVYDARSEELIEQVYLEGRVTQVVTALQNTLVDKTSTQSNISS